MIRPVIFCILIVLAVQAEEAAKPDPQVICSLPKVVGKFRAAFPRFYYNQESKDCLPFTYGGCDGNENNFETLEECNTVCGFTKEDCQLPAEPRMCMAYIPRFFYNSSNNTCMQFIYGGCRGNRNNFLTAEAYEKVCKH